MYAAPPEQHLGAMKHQHPLWFRPQRAPGQPDLASLFSGYAEASHQSQMRAMQAQVSDGQATHQSQMRAMEAQVSEVRFQALRNSIFQQLQGCLQQGHKSSYF